MFEFFLYDIFFLIFQAPIQATKGYSYFLCRSYCKNFPVCDWFSYSSANDQTCLLFTECPEKTNDITWVSSQQECNDYQCYLHNVQCRVCLFIILCQTIFYVGNFNELNSKFIALLIISG